jgi:uncharacterized protein DUF1302
MGTSFSRGGGGAIAAALLALALVFSSGSRAFAADLIATSGNALNVTGAAATVLPDANTAPALENGWLSGFHVSGFLSQQFGMWQNPPALRDYTPSRNNLSVSRTLLQVDENYRLNDSNNFFAREWFVYEPPYSFDSANNQGNAPGRGSASWSAASRNHSSFGHFMNGYYNNYQVRDAWWETKAGPLTVYTGNQIVVWGQSLAFRVGDVINPTDTCWAFGFANLEQSRTPQWMVHPILNLPEMGPFHSNFIEGVWQPGWAPAYWPEQTYDPYGKYIGEGAKAARALPCLPSASHGPSGRFDIHYTTQFRFGLDALLKSGAVVADPDQHQFWACKSLSGGLAKGTNPLPPKLRNFNCNLGLSKHNNPYSPIGDGSIIDIGVWNIPGYQPQNWNEGLRYHTLVGPAELTAFYYNDVMNGGSPGAAIWHPLTNLFDYHYQDIQEAGVTADAPLPMPSSLGEFLPIVGRAEMVYVNHEPFSDSNPYNFTAHSYSDLVKWMVALDIDQAYAPWLTSTGNLSANLEIYDQIIMDYKKTFVSNAVSNNMPKNDVSLLLNVGTSWLWNDIQPSYTMIFAAKGRNMAIFPAVVLNPPWTKKYFMKVQAIELLGGDKLSGVGFFKGQSMILATFQYNFNLL